MIDMLLNISIWWWLSILVGVTWFFWITRSGRDVDSRNVYSRLQRGWRRIVFWAGDVCFLPRFPYIQIGEKQLLVEPTEWMSALPELLAGDIVITRHKGYFFSNHAIPGFFKHALIVSKPSRGIGNINDISGMAIIEAISEGVVERHPIYVLSDYMVVLRPKNMTKEDREQAIKTASKIVGCEYDADFDFNIEEELAILNRQSRGLFEREREIVNNKKRELELSKINVKAEYDFGFSCTETISAAWWNKREELHLYRKYLRGRQVIIADQLINNGFEIIWTSGSITDKIAKELPEEGRIMVEQYLNKKELGENYEI